LRSVDKSLAPWLLGGIGLVAVLAGALVNVVEPLWFIAGALGTAAIAMLMVDYRVGVVCLTVLLPWFGSPLLPQAQGFNLVSYLTLASAASFVMHRMWNRDGIVWLPRVVWVCYLLPVAVGAFLALPNLAQGALNFGVGADGEQAFAPDRFVKSQVVKPMFFVVYAFLLANAVRHSERAERFLVPLVLSALLPAVGVIAAVAMGSGSVIQRDTFLQGLGLHPNEMGALLASAAGPLLFIAMGAGPLLMRLWCGVGLVLVTGGMMLTGTRGALVSYAVVVAVWLVRRRRLTDLLWVGAGLIAVAVSLPSEVTERLVLGLDSAGLTTASNMDDPLTKGRFASWLYLAPEVLESPIWGRGIGSTAWNAAVTAGRYSSTHPHNLYLEILLDLGLLGLLALLYLYYRYLAVMSQAGKHPDISPVLRDYFVGAWASFLGMLAMGVTNLHYMPRAEQTYIWFSLGMTFSYWLLASNVSKPTRGARRGIFSLGPSR